MSVWIKICANTSLADAQLAADAGADAVGFVFAPSQRRVTVEQVAEIVPHLPAKLEKIGVFVDVSFEDIASTVEDCGLTGVQLHFDATSELPASLRAHFGSGLRIIRTVHLDARTEQPHKGSVSGHDFSRAENASANEGALAPEACFSDVNIDAILIDAKTATATGGTGQTFDWSHAATTLFQNPKARKCIAAGGLNSENVAEAIRILRPWGIDVASGAEAAPGRKDPAKVRAFIANARVAWRG